MKTINRLLSFITIICFSISLGYSQQGSFKIGNIKYDYNNLEFSFSEGPGDVTFKIGKFSSSTSNTAASFSQNGTGDINIGHQKCKFKMYHLMLTTEGQERALNLI